jgi:hypothetical protein
MNGKAQDEQKCSAPGPKADLGRRVIAHRSTIHERRSPPARGHAAKVRNTIQATNVMAAGTIREPTITTIPVPAVSTTAHVALRGAGIPPRAPWPGLDPGVDPPIHLLARR